MTLALSLIPSAVTMTGGVSAVTGIGEEHEVTVAGLWVNNDTFTLIFADAASGLQTQVGFGNISGISPSFAFSYGNKVYLLAGPTAYFSGAGLPTTFNDPNVTTAGFVTLTDYFSTADNLVAMTPYQGRIAFFSRNNIQIWQVNADPTLWSQTQVLQNIGTMAALSVQSIGELDVMFLHDTGIRSLRVRDSSLNAYVDDIGSPIDLIIQALNLTDAERVASCGAVEPSSHRYWLFVRDTIYVFSAFRSSKVAAWGRYDATWSNAGVQTAFVPQKMVTFKGQVYCRDAVALYRYGGTDNNTYDNVVCTVETPFLDLKKPGTRRSARGIGVAMVGAWTIKAGMDSVSGILDTVYAASTQSFDQGIIPWSSQGTHVKFQAKTTGATAATLSEFVFHYDEGDEQ